MPKLADDEALKAFPVYRNDENGNLVNVSRSLVRKLCEVMKAVEYIQKKGQNTQQGYKYATEADVAELMRAEFAKRNVFVFPNVTRNSREKLKRVKTYTDRQGSTTVDERESYVNDVEIEWTFEDGDSGETRTCRIPGCSETPGDKGVYVAMTGSEKYLLMKSFLIPTGDDPENDENEPTGTVEAAQQVAQRKIDAHEAQKLEEQLKASIAQVKPKINQAPVEKAKPEPSREVGEVITGTIVELIQDKFRGIKLQRVGDKFPIKIAMWDNVQFPDKTRLYDYIKVGVAGAFECYVEKKGKFTNYKLIRPIHIGKTAFDDDGIPVIQRGAEVYPTDVNDILAEADSY